MAILEVDGLTKTYGSLCALDQVSLSLESGRIVGLLGPNGSGKTTFIKICNGLLVPAAGELRIDGSPVGTATKALSAYLPDRDFLPDWMKASDVIDYYSDFFSDFDAQKAGDMLEDLGIKADQKLGKMSKGTREKLRLIVTMARRAKIYFLDEPIAGVDPAARDYILRTIIANYNTDALVVISTHLIADVESVLDEAVLLRNGKVVLHAPVDEVRERTGKSLDEYFREVFAC